MDYLLINLKTGSQTDLPEIRLNLYFKITELPAFPPTKCLLKAFDKKGRLFGEINPFSEEDTLKTMFQKTSSRIYSGTYVKKSKMTSFKIQLNSESNLVSFSAKAETATFEESCVLEIVEKSSYVFIAKDGGVLRVDRINGNVIELNEPLNGVFTAIYMGLDYCESYQIFVAVRADQYIGFSLKSTLDQIKTGDLNIAVTSLVCTRSLLDNLENPKLFLGMRNCIGDKRFVVIDLQTTLSAPLNQVIILKIYTPTSSFVHDSPQFLNFRSYKYAINIPSLTNRAQIMVLAKTTPY